MLVYGLKELIKFCCDRDNSYEDIKLYNGVSKITSAMFIVKNDVDVLHQGFGFRQLLDVCKQEDITELTTRFVGLSEQQEECCEFYVFGVDGEQEEMIKTSITLSTPQGGVRQVCGEDCHKEEHNHTAEETNIENTPQQEEETTTEEIVEPEVVVDNEEIFVESNNPDFEFAESLLTDDEKQSKIDLSEYAESFGVTLKRNMKFENMLSTFKEDYNG